MTFRALLDRWQDTPKIVRTEARYRIRLDPDDAARVEALAELFPGIDSDTVLADLIGAALDATEAAMPYRPGDKVIENDEFGDPIFEDVGLTPRYVALVRAQRDKLG